MFVVVVEDEVVEDVMFVLVVEDDVVVEDGVMF